IHAIAAPRVTLDRKLAHGAEVKSIAFSPDGRRLATGGIDGTVKWWDARTGRQLRSLRKRGDRISQVAFSPDGNVFMAASAKEDQDGYREAFDIFEARSGRLRSSIKGRKGVGYVCALSPDGKTMAASGIGYPDGTWYGDL